MARMIRARRLRLTSASDGLSRPKAPLRRGVVSRTLLVALALVLVVVVAVVLLWPRQRPELRNADNAEGRGAASDASDGGSSVGGVRRPFGDRLAADQDDPNGRRPGAGDESEDLAEGDLNFGQKPPTDPDANPQTRSVFEAIEGKRDLQRVSALLPATPYDPEAFRADPESYLSVVEPGRAFQVAQAEPGTPALASLSDHYSEVRQGEAVELAVAAPPGSPVSFTSLDLGQFDNGLTATSVRADEEGRAAATFVATPGTLNDVDIVAGSPEASGVVRFIVHVLPPP